MLNLIEKQDKIYNYVVTSLSIFLVLVAAKCFYNLFLHPLSHFPGTKMAALGLSELWYDVIKDGQYLWEIERMHDQYGPIIRINVGELHIRDSEYYTAIYAAYPRIVNKDAATVRAFSLPTSAVATVDHHLHRSRRSYLKTYFSKRSVVSMETDMYERIERLCERLHGFMLKKEIVVLDSAFAALTADIINRRFFGEHHNYLDVPDFRNDATEAFFAISSAFHLVRFVPGVVGVLKSLPISVINMVFPPFARLLAMQETTKLEITKHKTDKNEKSASIILSALDDITIPPAEREVDRLLDEGSTILFAGSETVARTLSVGMFYLLDNKTHISKLRRELSRLPHKAAKAYSLAQLEPLQYLSGVVRESLRLSFVASNRLPRVSTQEALQYKNYTIPAGTPVSQSTYFVHTDPAIFPNPHSFDPTRWIKAAEAGFPLSKYLVSFTKGSRQCLGIEMAYAELYMVFARIVLSFDMDLYQTTRDDVNIRHIRLSSFPQKANGQLNMRGEIMVKITRATQDN